MLTQIRLNSKIKFARPQTLEHDGIVLNRLSHEISVLGQPHHLCYKEFDLLWLLMECRGAIVRLKDIKELVWGHTWAVSEGTISRYVERICEKLGVETGKLIVSIPTLGYKLETPKSGTKTP